MCRNNSFNEHHPNPEAVKKFNGYVSCLHFGVTTYFQYAKITFDKWHVIKLMHKHLKDLRSKAISFTERIGVLIDEVTDFYTSDTVEEVELQLCFIADFADECLGKKPFSTSIRRHFEGIVNYCTSSITNGIMEGINSKIQTIKRIARGC